MSSVRIRSSRRRFLKTAAAGAVVASAPLAAGAESFEREADVLVIGAGAAGLTAATVARERGASVTVLEAGMDIGGHAIVSGGNVPLGGGTSLQRKYGIVDSPDLLFRDLTDWSVVEPNGFPDYRYNDKDVIRAFADHSAETFEWLVAHGVVFVDKAPDGLGGLAVGNSVPREAHAAPMHWPQVQSGHAVDAAVAATSSSGVGLARPLEAAARGAGAQILLRHRMQALVREPRDGRVVGVIARHPAGELRLRARRAVIIATGGSSGNVHFRRMFDPRLTEEYTVAGMPWSDADASGELAAMDVGASLWGLYNQSGEFGYNLCKAGLIGCRHGYPHLRWLPGSPVFAAARASGLSVSDWQDLILVNLLGQRFYDETGSQFTANDYKSLQPYIADSYRNAANIRYQPNNFLNAALAGIGDAHNGGGPIWAVFDADAVAREGWDPRPPNVDLDGYFFSAPTLAELARQIVMPHQRLPMPAANLEATVARYNGFVDAAEDADFGKPGPRFKIEKPPFYAAWSTPVVHDTRAGLRINGRCQVMDRAGGVISGLYCGGESAGGFSQHGLARATCQGYIAGSQAATA